LEGGFQIGEWQVEAERNRLVRADHPEHAVRIEPKAMRVLVYLAEHAGEVVEKEKVVQEVWEGAFVTDEVLTNAIWELRKALGDDSKSAQFIQTIPRKGYRLIAPVAALEEGSAVSLPRRWRQAVPWILLAAASLIAILAIRNLRQPGSQQQLVARFPIAVTGDLGPLYAPVVALSPDASRLVYVSSGNGGSSRLHLRDMDQMSASPIPGTQGARSPFFSPDGQWIGFFVEGKLRKVNLNDGGPAIDICDVGAARGAWWGPDERVYYTPGASGAIWRIPADGGEPEAVTELDEENAEWTHRWPYVLPSGKAVLFTVGDKDLFSGFDEAKIVAQSLASGERRVLIEGGSFSRSVLDHIVYMRDGALMAVPFDAGRLEVTGPARPVLQWVKWFPINGTAQFALSGNGSLVYVPGGPEWEEPRKLVWVDRRGEATPVTDDSRIFYDPGLSPDGERIAVAVAREGNTDLWLYDVNRDTLSRLTASGGEDEGPIWTPDGKRITYYYGMAGPFQIYSRSADGSGEPEKIFKGQNSQRPESWSPDGKVLVFSENDPATGFDIWSLDIEGSKAEPILNTTFDELHGALSPDGRWLAYVSDESGTYEIYVRPFPGPGGKWQISTDGGDNPKWARRGKELLYRDGDKMMTVSVTTEPELRVGKPSLLFEWRHPPRLFEGLHRRYYDVTPDGQRFLMVEGQESGASRQLHVVLNWAQELED
jgi:serine/threonine-protein kinase